MSEQKNKQDIPFLSFYFDRGMVIGLVLYVVVLVAGFFSILVINNYWYESVFCSPATYILAPLCGIFWPGISLYFWLSVWLRGGDGFNLISIFLDVFGLLGIGMGFAIIGKCVSRGFTRRMKVLSFLLILSYSFVAFSNIVQMLAPCLG